MSLTVSRQTTVIVLWISKFRTLWWRISRISYLRTTCRHVTKEINPHPYCITKYRRCPWRWLPRPEETRETGRIWLSAIDYSRRSYLMKKMTTTYLMSAWWRAVARRGNRRGNPEHTHCAWSLILPAMIKHTNNGNRMLAAREAPKRSLSTPPDIIKPCSGDRLKITKYHWLERWSLLKIQIWNKMNLRSLFPHG